MTPSIFYFLCYKLRRTWQLPIYVSPILQTTKVPSIWYQRAKMSLAKNIALKFTKQTEAAIFIFHTALLIPPDPAVASNSLLQLHPTMAEVMNMPVESLDGSREQKEKSTEDQPPPPPPPPQQPQRRRERDSRERRDDRDLDRPPNRRADYYDRNRSPPPPPIREREYKRRSSLSPPPQPYRDRRHSPPRRSPPPPYKRSRRDDGGYDGRRGSPREGFAPGDRRCDWFWCHFEYFVWFWWF